MNSPAISVAMSVYNSGPFLADAIESILSQTIADFEFLIVDDGSTDGSGEAIDDYARRDSRIAAIHQENRGLVASLNHMIELAQGKWFARMDSDDIACPDRFQERLAGRPDPVDNLDWLPEVGMLDASFEIDAADSYARSRIVERIIYSPEVLAGEGFEVLVGHIRDAGSRPALWRAVLRLARAGHFSQAARLGAKLATA